MRKLRDIYADYQTAREGAAINLESVEPKTLAAHAAKKRAAEDNQLKFKVEYHGAVRAALAGLILVDVSPARAKRFVDVARSIVPVVVQDAGALYKEIAAPVAASMGAQGVWPRMMDTPQWTMLFATMRDKVDALQCMILPSGKPMLYPDAGRHIQPFQTIEDVPRIVKEMIRHSNGDEFNRVALGYALAESTFQLQPDLDVDEDGAPEVVPAIFTGVDPDEIQGLAPLFGRGHLVVTDVPRRDSISKDYVLGRLEALREVVKQNQNS